MYKTDSFYFINECTRRNSGFIFYMQKTSSPNDIAHYSFSIRNSFAFFFFTNLEWNLWIYVMCPFNCSQYSTDLCFFLCRCCCCFRNSYGFLWSPDFTTKSTHSINDLDDGTHIFIDYFLSLTTVAPEF